MSPTISRRRAVAVALATVAGGSLSVSDSDVAPAVDVPTLPAGTVVAGVHVWRSAASDRIDFFHVQVEPDAAGQPQLRVSRPRGERMLADDPTADTLRTVDTASEPEVARAAAALIAAITAAADSPLAA